MAIEIKDPAPPTKSFWRTWQILISTPANVTPDRYTVTWQRGLSKRHAETGELLENTDYANDPLRCPSKSAGEFGGKSWTTPQGKVITAAEIMWVLAAAGDEFHQELIDNPPQTDSV